MSSIGAIATTENNPNYLGFLFELGNNSTTFLDMIGGLNSTPRNVLGWDFDLNANYALDQAEQPSISEDASANAPTPTTFANGQDTNAIQIFQRTVAVTYANASDVNTLAGAPLRNGDLQLTDKSLEQLEKNLRQMKVNLDYTCVNGVYQAKTNSATASQSRGIMTACTTNNVDLLTADLTKADFDAFLKQMWANGADFKTSNYVIHVNGSAKLKLTELYGLAERSSTVGGVAVDILISDFGTFPIALNNTIPDGEILVANMDICGLAYLPYNGQVIAIEPLAKVGAVESQQIYSQLGMDYGPRV